MTGDQRDRTRAAHEALEPKAARIPITSILGALLKALNTIETIEGYARGKISFHFGFSGGRRWHFPRFPRGHQRV